MTDDHTEEAQDEYEGPFDGARDEAIASETSPAFSILTGVCAGLVGFGSLALWVIARSSYIHEGGSASGAPEGPLVFAVICFLIAVVAIFAGIRDQGRKET